VALSPRAFGVSPALSRPRKAAPRPGDPRLPDIHSFFDTIDKNVLMELVGRRTCDRRVLKLIRKWLDAGVLDEDNVVRNPNSGPPQGGVISPLLANIYLHELDREWQRDCLHLGILVRYADDFVVLCHRESQATKAMQRLREIFARLKLTLHPEKTKLVADLNPVLKGWGNYFRTGNASKQFNQLDYYVWRRITRMLGKQRGFHGHPLAWRVRSNGVHGRWRNCEPVACTSCSAPSNTQGARRHEQDHRSAVCGKTARTVGK